MWLVPGYFPDFPSRLTECQKYGTFFLQFHSSIHEVRRRFAYREDAPLMWHFAKTWAFFVFWAGLFV
jgi:hypothetical protein